MKKILLSAIAGLVLVSACKKDDETVPTMQVTGTFSGSQEVPAVSAAGTGTFAGTYTPSTKSLVYTITYTGLTGAPTGSHLHYGNAKHATAAPTVLFTGIPTTASGTFSGTATLTAMQADSLTAGRIYTNIHTSANAGGEIRANLTAK